MSHLVAVPGLLPVSVPFAVLPATVLGPVTVAGLMTGPSTLQLASTVMTFKCPGSEKQNTELIYSKMQVHGNTEVIQKNACRFN